MNYLTKEINSKTKVAFITSIKNMTTSQDECSKKSIFLTENFLKIGSINDRS